VLRTLLDAVDRLERPYREAIVLRYFDEPARRARSRVASTSR
jgi:DNA-directed RNA polymerase specialized sigma24 family protein